MKTIMFSKFQKDKTVRELLELAQKLNLDGYDLCLRAGYAVNPDNVTQALPEMAALFRGNGLDIPMITGEGNLLAPDQPGVRPILAAMDKANVRLIKLGYFTFDPTKLNYLAEVDRIRRIFEGWQTLAREYNVKICYHTHSNRCMGLNASGLAHLLHGFDPACIGAYLDAGHLVVEGEDYPTAFAIVKDYLSILAVKDVLLERVEKNGHGSVKKHWVTAGNGSVDWTLFFETAKKFGYNGPVSVHCEFEVPKP